MSISHFSWLLIVILFLACKSTHRVDGETHIRQAMAAQEKAWNAGDIDSFMQFYWPSDSLLFIGRSGPTYGWHTTLANYQKAYPDQATMGRLSFDIHSIEPLAEDAFFVVGKYTLQRTADAPSGYFTLVWKYMNDRWVIVVDHTSG